jgi:hypothetical protein
VAISTWIGGSTSRRSASARCCAVGALDHHETAAALIEQGEALGLTAIECERTVASGLAAGMEQPRSLALKPSGQRPMRLRAVTVVVGMDSSAQAPIRTLGPVADVVRLSPVAAAPNDLVDN